MSRLSIELTEEQHQRLKAMAALSGKSIKNYVLDRTLPNIPNVTVTSTTEDTLHQLEQFLQPRIEAAERGERSSRTPLQIFGDVNRELS